MLVALNMCVTYQTLPTYIERLCIGTTERLRNVLVYIVTRCTHSFWQVKGSAEKVKSSTIS